MAKQQRDPGREQYWRELVTQWQASGLSVREFCSQRQVKEACPFGGAQVESHDLECSGDLFRSGRQQRFKLIGWSKWQARQRVAEPEPGIEFE
jgi:hypothetical protein